MYFWIVIEVFDSRVFFGIYYHIFGLSSSFYLPSSCCVPNNGVLLHIIYFWLLTSNERLSIWLFPIQLFVSCMYIRLWVFMSELFHNLATCS